MSDKLYYLVLLVLLCFAWFGIAKAIDMSDVSRICGALAIGFWAGGRYVGR